MWNPGKTRQAPRERSVGKTVRREGTQADRRDMAGIGSKGSLRRPAHLIPGGGTRTVPDRFELTSLRAKCRQLKAHLLPECIWARQGRGLSTEWRDGDIGARGGSWPSAGQDVVAAEAFVPGPDARARSPGGTAFGSRNGVEKIELREHAVSESVRRLGNLAVAHGGGAVLFELLVGKVAAGHEHPRSRWSPCGSGARLLFEGEAGDEVGHALFDGPVGSG
jgi:hypothetical protein